MSNPQQPELARSRKTPAQDQDAVAAVVEGQRPPVPGHHPAKEQDKPDLDAFAAKLGVAGDAVSEDGAAPGERDAGPQAAPTRTTVIGVAGAVATVVAVILAVVAGRRRRSRRSG
jgi:hypothetical protein